MYGPQPVQQQPMPQGYGYPGDYGGYGGHPGGYGGHPGGYGGHPGGYGGHPGGYGGHPGGYGGHPGGYGGQPGGYGGPPGDYGGQPEGYGGPQDGCAPPPPPPDGPQDGYPPPPPPGGPPPHMQRKGMGGLPPFMERPKAIEGCPPGLEYLTMVDQLIVHQLMEPFEMFTGIETNNRYIIMDPGNVPVYMAAENSSAMQLRFGGSNRAFTIDILDNMGARVMKLYRPRKCCRGLCYGAFGECLQDEVIVEAATGQPIARVRQLAACCNTELMVQLLPERLAVAHVEGPCCCETRMTLMARTFQVTAPRLRRQNIGGISKLPGDYCREFFTDADTFSCNFRIDLDPRTKAGILAATFLIDFLAYESNPNDNHHRY